MAPLRPRNVNTLNDIATIPLNSRQCLWTFPFSKPMADASSRLIMKLNRRVFVAPGVVLVVVCCLPVGHMLVM